MVEIIQSLGRSPTPDMLDQSSEQVQAELSHWAESVMQRENQNQGEIKQIIGVLAQTIDSIAAKDEIYGSEIGNVTGRMQAIGELHDLAEIRKSIVESTTLLKSSVQRMMEDSKAATQILTVQMNEYRSRVEAAERAAELDQLTGLGNRRAFEKQLSARLNAVQNFSLIMIDINDFKMMNDRHGHLAGDDLLRQFATELHAHLLPLETACRWGGDEFALLIPGGDKPGGEKEDMQRVDQLRQWVLGEYRIDTGNEKVKTVVTASFGVAHWDGKESGIELVARADQGMYRDKEATSAAIASEPPE